MDMQLNALSHFGRESLRIFAGIAAGVAHITFSQRLNDANDVATERPRVRSVRMRAQRTLATLLTPLMLLPGITSAATIVVNSLADAVPASGASGCTLRKAIENANAGSGVHADCAAGGASNEITFSVNGTINLTSSTASNGVLNIINRPLIITGNGVGLTIIRAAAAQHVFDNFGSAAASTITWRNLSVQAGSASAASGFTNGGAFFIDTLTTATMDRIEVTGNSAASGGGAIDNRGTLTITNSTFSQNTAVSEGGAIRNAGTLTITGSTFNANSATRGGAIFHVSTNAAHSVNITNSTFSANSVSQGSGSPPVGGGAIAVNSSAVLAPVTISHSTFFGNVANVAFGGAFYVVSGAAFNVNRSLVKGSDGSAAAICGGTSNITSQGYNTLTSGCSTFVQQGTDVVEFFTVDPLANNGGTTLTHGLPAYSTLRDRIPSGACSTGNDQAAKARPLGLGCDPGAFEATPTVPLPPTITSATTGNGTALVSFSTPNNGGSAIQFYELVASPGGITINGFSPIAVGGLTNGVTYTFTVRARNAVGSSVVSAPSSPVTPTGPPGPPVIGTATRGNGQATVNFSPPSSNGGSPITGYRVVSLPGNITVDGSASPITVAGLSNGTGYTFRVQALNVLGTSSPSLASNQVVPATVPTAPGMGSATAGNGQATVSFSPPQNNGGDPVVSYTVVSTPGGISATGTASPITVTGLTNGIAYTFTVAATNSVGAGPSSAASNAITTLPALIVTPSAGANGSIGPNIPFGVANGASTILTVTPLPGYTASVGGTCGGTLAGATFTTNPVTTDCTVVASFALGSVQYRLGEDDPMATIGSAGNAATLPNAGNYPALDRTGAPQYVAGANGIGTAMRFDGASVYRSATMPSLLTAQDNFALELWAKTATLGSNANGMLFYAGNSAIGGFGIFRESNDTYSALFGGVAVISGIPASTGWMHLALVRAGGVSTLYANGVAVGSVSAGPIPAGGTFAIGGNPNGVSEFFDGSIDEVRVRAFEPGTFNVDQLSVRKLSVNVTGAGSVVAAGTTCTGACELNGIPGSAFTLTATPAAGSVFAGWSGVACSGGNAGLTCDFTLSANVTITATFTPEITALIVPNDLNDDGRSDLLWRNGTDGSVQGWLMNGLAATQVAGLLPSGDYTVTHVADLDGNGKADTLIRHSDGTTIGWLHDGLNVVGQTTFFAPGSGWSIKHTADLDGDGKADLIVEHTDGTVVGWLMNGLTVTGTATFVPAGTGWSVSRVGDLNGDGKADLIWQNTNGTVLAWLMDGLSATQTATFVGAGTGWSVKLVGDFNGDNKADLVWQNTDGTVQAWLMDGTAITQIASFVPAGTGWSPVLAGDIDGDGKADLFWEHTDGRSQTWLMNGLTVTNLAGFVGAGGWKATHLLDLNGDGKKDVIWKHSDGTVQGWLMNGLSISQIASLAGAGEYSVVPPNP